MTKQRGTDDYERKYMAGGESPGHREKLVWKYHWIFLPFVPLCWSIATMVLLGMGNRPAPLWMSIPLVLLGAMFAMIWVVFAVLRVHVTQSEVHIQYGLAGPHIPLDAIESVEVVDYKLSEFGGWGIRRSMDGTWAYSLMGDSAKVVKITWTVDGKTKKVVVSSRNPPELAAQIDKARAATSRRVRVAEIPAKVGELEEERVEEETEDETKRAGRSRR